jgi:phenylalanyl-tRNA synthetase beta chain
VKVLLSWVRDFVDLPESAEVIGARMSMRGLALEGIEPVASLPLPPWGTHRDADAVLDFDVTANRPDCLSMLGVAREIATAFARPLLTLDASVPTGSTAAARGTDAEISVSIEEPDLCGEYTATIATVRVGPSPDWLQARLSACGVRPISNVVDVTNYVLLELGHPMHAFDLARLRGPAIVVRRARPGETIKTLDGKNRALNRDMLVIADAERPVAIGGVMGGAESEVSAHTTRIALESAWFKPQSVRATANALGLRTEASYRFERGADRTAPVVAMKRALSLLEMIGASDGSGPIVDCHPRRHEPRELTIDAGSIESLLGMHVPGTEAVRILRALGFTVKTLGSWQAAQPDVAMPVGLIGHVWNVTVPGWRVDVQRSVDLIEEVGRHYGFENLPTTFPAVEQPPPPSDPRIARDARARRGLLAMGFNEAITFAFIEAAAAAPFAGQSGPVKLANPLSENFAVLRPSLLPGLVDAVSHNRRHGMRDVRLFEIGTRFSRAGETRGAAVAWTGLSTREHWSGDYRPVDFFDIKGVAVALCAVMDVEAESAVTTREYLLDGHAADVVVDGAVVGAIGQLSPAFAVARGLPASDPIYVGEIDLDALSSRISSEPRKAEPLPRHPSVVRDIAVLVDDTLSAETVRGTIRSASPATLVEVREFDRYQGKGVPDGKVSLALRLTFRANDRTLTDAEVSTAVNAIVAVLTKQLGAIQR